MNIKNGIDSLPAPHNVRLEEWKECRQSIARFDQIIVDIRKYGFSLVTILLGAAGFLYTSPNITLGSILGVYFALSILIFALFRVDRYHEIFLRASVARAMEVEKTLQMTLSSTIDGQSKLLKTDTWGLSLYLLFWGANLVLVFGKVLEFDALTVSFKKNCLFIIISLFIAAVFLTLILIYHKKEQ